MVIPSAWGPRSASGPAGGRFAPLAALDAAHLLRRHPGVDRARRHVAGDDRAGRDDRVLADRARAEDRRVARHPRALLDQDVAAAAGEGAAAGGALLGDVVRAGQDRDAVAEERVRLDRNRPRDGVEHRGVDLSALVDLQAPLVAEDRVVMEPLVAGDLAHPLLEPRRLAEAPAALEAATDLHRGESSVGRPAARGAGPALASGAA